MNKTIITILGIILIIISISFVVGITLIASLGTANPFPIIWPYFVFASVGLVLGIVLTRKGSEQLPMANPSLMSQKKSFLHVFVFIVVLIAILYAGYSLQLIFLIAVAVWSFRRGFLRKANNKYFSVIICLGSIFLLVYNFTHFPWFPTIYFLKYFLLPPVILALSLGEILQKNA